MASLGVFTIGSGGGGRELRFARAGAADRSRILALLLTGEANAHDPAVDEFVRFAEGQQLDTSELWAAFEGDRPVGAALMVPSPGRTGMVFLSPVRGREQVRIQADLVRALTAAQDPRKCRLLQCLLDPQQQREMDAAVAAGFAPLANLVYMERASELLGSRVAREEFGEGLAVVHWEGGRRALFERAILASYEDTLDCPKLLGLRGIEDIVAGHMATGRFDPGMWYVLTAGDEPAAVMLINELPGRSAVELVYLGLSVPWRGRGLARRLLEHGIDLAARRGLTSMLLAVDEDNAPALALYRGLGFRPTARKRAVIRALA